MSSTLHEPDVFICYKKDGDYEFIDMKGHTTIGKKFVKFLNELRFADEYGSGHFSWDFTTYDNKTLLVSGGICLDGQHCDIYCPVIDAVKQGDVFSVGVWGIILHIKVSMFIPKYTEDDLGDPITLSNYLNECEFDTSHGNHDNFFIDQYAMKKHKFNGGEYELINGRWQQQDS